MVENWNNQLKATVLGRGKDGKEVGAIPLGKMQLMEVVDMLQVIIVDGDHHDRNKDDNCRDGG